MLQSPLILIALAHSLAGEGTDAGAAAVAASQSVVNESRPGFVVNEGQIAGPARFYATGSGFAAYFEPGAVVLDRPAGEERPLGIALRVEFPAAQKTPAPTVAASRAARINVLRGNDRSRWRTGLATYDEVRYRDIAPGSDLVYRIEDGHLEYDVIVAPRANLSAVRLRYRGASSMSLSREGALRIATAAGVLEEAPPRLYQEEDGRRVPVEGGFRILSRGELGFWAGAHDPSRPLVVDPGLLWSTFLGGSGADSPNGVATCGSGGVYVVGTTTAMDYPTSPGAYQPAKAAGNDVTITKFDRDGALVWSTLLGGNNADVGRGVAVDASNNVYVCGETMSTDFPTTPGAFRTAIALAGTYDAFVTKIGPDGNALGYSTYAGGTNSDYARAIAVDGSGGVAVGGFTSSIDFPTTPGVVKPSRNPSLFDGSDGFVLRLNGAGSAATYSTYVGSNGGTDAVFALALDGSGRVSVTGWTSSQDFPTSSGAFQRTFRGVKDAFVTQLTPGGNGYVFSTYYGGGNFEEGHAVAVDPSGNTLVGGLTLSTDFPTTPGSFQPSWGGGSSVYDGFVVKLSPSGAPIYGSFLGGSGSDAVYEIAIGPGGQACAIGVATSTNFPVTPGAYSTGYAGGAADAFATAIASDGSRLEYSTYLGSAGNDQAAGVAVLPTGSVVVVGTTDGSGFPTTPGAFDRAMGAGGGDGFVSVFDMGLAVPAAVGSGPAFARIGAPQPNPFRSETRFALDVAAESRIQVRIVDLAGRTVRLLEDRRLAPGRHEIRWDGSDESGRPTGAGVYLVEVASRTGRIARSLVRVK